MSKARDIEREERDWSALNWHGIGRGRRRGEKRVDVHKPSRRRRVQHCMQVVHQEHRIGAIGKTFPEGKPSKRANVRSNAT